MADTGRENQEADAPTEGAGAADGTAQETSVENTDDASSPLSGLSKVLGSKPAAKPEAPAAPAKPQKKGGKGAGITQDGVKEPPPPLPAGALVTVVTRNEFYRDGFRNLIRIAILEGVIIVGLILTLIVYINNSVSHDRYFATTADGRIMQLAPLNQPYMTTAALLSWVAQAATDVMTFGFHDYQRQLQAASRHFTKTGWETFTTALQASRIVESVQAQQQVVTAVPRSAPVLLKQGVLNGRYRWVIQMPIQVSYKATNSNRNDNLLLTLVIERVPSLENPDGVGIEQWIAEQK